VVSTRGIFLTDTEVEDIMRRFRLRSFRHELENVIRGRQNRGVVIVTERAPLYPYALESGIGIHVEIPESDPILT